VLLRLGFLALLGAAFSAVIALLLFFSTRARVSANHAAFGLVRVEAGRSLCHSFDL